MEIDLFPNDVCVVIPAAGRGTRLGMSTPKILLEIADNVAVWDILWSRLRPFVHHAHVVLAPSVIGQFADYVARELHTEAVSVNVQAEPTGMGDAIFGAEPIWRSYEAVLIVWGDQVNLDSSTVAATLDRHKTAARTGPALTLPVVAMSEPYVEYVLDGPRLAEVRMSREGADCTPGALSDVGVFCLSTKGLSAAWNAYVSGSSNGVRTGEVNFLPFLPYLSSTLGWLTTTIEVKDAAQARGINTIDDLSFARSKHIGRVRG